jgi:hypothetical protein
MPFFLWLPGLLALLCAGNLYADQAAELNVGTAVTLPRLPHDQVNITVDGVIDEAA